MYDENNIFAKILRQEIPCEKIYEDEYAVAFNDIFPKKKLHVLVIPKGKYSNLTDFLTNASKEAVANYFAAFPLIINKLELTSGYRVISNCGQHGRQEVGHLHFHILGGEDLGNIVCNHK